MIDRQDKSAVAYLLPRNGNAVLPTVGERMRLSDGGYKTMYHFKTGVRYVMAPLETFIIFLHFTFMTNRPFNVTFWPPRGYEENAGNQVHITPFTVGQTGYQKDLGVVITNKSSSRAYHVGSNPHVLSMEVTSSDNSSPVALTTLIQSQYTQTRGGSVVHYINRGRIMPYTF